MYVLQSQKDGKRYVGVTADPERRLGEHERGLVRSTRNRRPVRLIHKETYPTKEEALIRERFLKSGQGRQWLRQNGL